MAVPNIFATATSSIPLSQLDTNFATAITLGSTALYLGNTTTSVAGLTLTGGAFNGTVGATTPSTGAFTTLSSTLDATIYGLTVGRGGGAVSSNTAVGASALAINSTGANSVACGNTALALNISGSNNTAVGAGAGKASTVSNNTFIGSDAGETTTTGTFNAFLGRLSGYLVTSGGKNTIIGSYTGNSGGLDIRTASNYIVLSDGDGNPRGYFDNGGKFIVGTTVTDPAYYRSNGVVLNAGTVLLRNSGGGSDFGMSTTSGNNINFYTDNGSARVTAGSITSNGATTLYNATSDYRLKENIQPMTGALAKVIQLKPVTFDWKDEFAGTQKNSQGFIAHELAEVCPHAVTGEKDAVEMRQYEISPAIPATQDEEGNELTAAVEAVMGEREVPRYQGIDTSFLVATLTAAIQEQQAIITALTTRITALEAK